MTGSDWYCQLVGLEFGPLTFDDLRQMARKGELAPEDPLREGTSGEWTPAGSRAGLFDAVEVGRGISPTDIDPHSGGTALDEFTDLSELTFEDGDASGPTLLSHPIIMPPLPRPESEFELPEIGTQESELLWYIQTLGDVFGPVSFEALLEMVQEGQLAREDLLRFGETGHWIEAGSLEGLFPTLVQAPAEVFESAPSAAPAASQPAAAKSHPSAPRAASPAAVAANGEPREWYCQLIGREFGPLSLTELREFYTQGRLADGDPVRQGTQGNWMAAGSVLAALAAAPVPPPRRTTTVESALTQTGGRVAEAQWFCFVQDQEWGPFSLEQMVSMVGEGRIAADTLLRLGTSGEWFAAGDIGELFRPAAPVPPMAAVPKAANEPEAPSDAGEAKRRIQVAGMDRTLEWLEKHCPPSQSGPEAKAAASATKTAASAATAGAAAAPAKGAAPKVEASRQAAQDIIRNLSAQGIPRPAVKAGPRVRAPRETPAWVSALGGVKFDAKTMGVLAVIVLGAGVWWVVPYLSQRATANTVYDGFTEVYKEIKAGHEAKRDPLQWEAQAKEIRKRISELNRKVKSAKSGTPGAILRRTTTYLEEMAMNAAKPPGDKGDEAYTRSEKQYQDYMQRAAKALGR